MKKIIIILMSLISATSYGYNKHREICANNINIENVKLPETVDGNKSLAANGMGYIFFTPSPVSKAFIENEAKPGKRLIEIGAGYTDIPIEAIRHDVDSYTANDVSFKHLQILVARTKNELGQNYLKKLKLLIGKAPHVLPTEPHRYDAILAEKVMHFMKPDEIMQFIDWSKTVLKPGGKIYITTATPYSRIYHKLLPDYLRKLHQGNLFPGHFQHVMHHVDKKLLHNYPKFKVPNEMVLFGRQDLVNLFEIDGMKVIESFSLKIPTKDEPSWQLASDEDCNIVGIIAQKKY